MTPPSPVIYAGTRRYTHRWRYDSRFGRLLGEAWPNGVGRGFVYSSIGSVELETGLSSAADYGLDQGVPPVLRSVQLVNALGAPTRELLGDTTGTHLVVERNQNVQTGETESVSYTRGAAAIWSETYRYDAFGNLQRRAQQQDGGYTQVEHFSYDRLHRMTESRLITGASAAPAVAFGYDAVGNLTRKTDYSTAAPNAYTYSAERPNAVSAVALATGGTQLYFYDASGNVRCSYISRSQASCTASHGSEYQARYNHNQQPVYQQRNQTYQTALAPSISHHTYGADQQPARQWGKEHSTNCATPGFNGCLEHHRIYLDRYEDTVGTFRHFNGGDRLYRTRAYVGDYAVFTRGRYGELEMSLLLRDRLGSVVGVESARLIGGRINTIVSESRHGFDAFGAPRANRERSGTSWQTRDPWQTPSRTQQGFTGHERLRGLQLIHMKGRVFDPILGRFHGVDPIIQFPLSSQGLNPYSYILNNPMAGVDPTGYQSVRESCNRRQSCEMRYSALATLAGDLKSDVAGMSTMGGALGDTFRVVSSTANNGARGSLGAKVEKFEGAVEIGGISEVGKNEGGGFAFRSMAHGREMVTGSEPGEPGATSDFSVGLSKSFAGPHEAAIAFGNEYGPRGVAERIEYNTVIIRTPTDLVGPPSYAYTDPLAGEVRSTVVELGKYLKFVGDTHGARNAVALAHNHFDSNLRFSGIGLDTTVARQIPLYLRNVEGQTRLLNFEIIQKESAGTRGAKPVERYASSNSGFSGVCIHGCQ